MKTAVRFGNFFKTNTPKYAQIIGDLGLVMSVTATAIIALPATMEANGIVGFVLPAFFLTVAKYAMAAGATIKFISKFIGQIESTLSQTV